MKKIIIIIVCALQLSTFTNCASNGAKHQKTDASHPLKNAFNQAKKAFSAQEIENYKQKLSAIMLNLNPALAQGDFELQRDYAIKHIPNFGETMIQIADKIYEAVSPENQKQLNTLAHIKLLREELTHNQNELVNQYGFLDETLDEELTKLKNRPKYQKLYTIETTRNLEYFDRLMQRILEYLGAFGKENGETKASQFLIEALGVSLV